MQSEHDWITLHRVRFAKPVSAVDYVFDAPQGPDCWRFCVQHTLGPDNMPTWKSDVWAALGIWSDRGAAERMIADPAALMPALGDAVEAWHALALPIQHRGEVRWRGMIEKDCAIRPCSEDIDAPLAVVTSASFDDPQNPAELPRMSRFAVKVSEAIEFLARQPGNLRRGVFNGGFDGREGFTLTLWESDDAMLRAAYHSGHHRTLMDESRDGSIFDRSSFTRLRLLQTRGSWSGDPLKTAA
jgi:hypothetical protein